MFPKLKLSQRSHIHIHIDKLIAPSLE
uniref:Uncharacterized protein n=1 Tax=Arundo donax TaxID=35708 RepID=A0A0A9ER98_ARUDO